MKITCGIFLFDGEDNILICRVTNSKNLWSIPKGLVDENETFIDTALRELKEETSIILNNPQLKFIGDFKYLKSNKMLKAFYLKIDEKIDENSLHCSSMVNLKGRIFPEVDQFKWVNLEEAKKLIHKTQVDALIEFEKLKYQF